MILGCRPRPGRPLTDRERYALVLAGRYVREGRRDLAAEALTWAARPPVRFGIVRWAA